MAHALCGRRSLPRRSRKAVYCASQPRCSSHGSIASTLSMPQTLAPLTQARIEKSKQFANMRQVTDVLSCPSHVSKCSSCLHARAETRFGARRPVCYNFFHASAIGISHML
eukprot:6175152-Pleurochrysis_carterae.AAC.1